MKRRVAMLLLVAAAAFGGGALVSARPDGTAGVDASGQPQVKRFDGVRAIAPFSLTDHRGQRFDRERLIGRWTLITFGFTNCPDACPTMLTNLAEVRKSLPGGWEGPEPQFVLVSVDPRRDTQQVLAQYVPAFDATFLGVTGTQAEVDRVHADFGGAHRIPRGASAHYSVDHSVLLYVVDPEGRLHAQIAPPFDPAGVARKIARDARAFASAKG